MYFTINLKKNVLWLSNLYCAQSYEISHFIIHSIKHNFTITWLKSIQYNLWTKKGTGWKFLTWQVLYNKKILSAKRQYDNSLLTFGRSTTPENRIKIGIRKRVSNYTKTPSWRLDYYLPRAIYLSVYSNPKD